MAKFTHDNTQGFSVKALRNMNRALDNLLDDGFDDDMNQISDFIFNHYPATSKKYVQAYKSYTTDYDTIKSILCE